MDNQKAREIVEEMINEMKQIANLENNQSGVVFDSRYFKEKEISALEHLLKENENLKLELDACLKGARIEAERADKFQEQNSKLKKERDDQEKLKRKYSDKLGDKNQEVWKLKETARELIHKMEKYGNVIDLTEEIKTLKTLLKEDK